jgi:outer membrane protein assembly factor BamB
MPHRLLVALAIALSTVSSQALEWPSFRGPNAAGVADTARPPLVWSLATGSGVAWKTAIPGLAHSSPIVWGDRVFLTTAVTTAADPVFRPGYSSSGLSAEGATPHEWRLYAIDRRSGRILWHRAAHAGIPRTLRHQKSSQASSTPATNGRVVVAFFGSEGLHAFDITGRPLWKQDLGVLDAGSIYYPERQWGVASSPVIDGDRIIVQCDSQQGSFLAAFDLTTGRELWRTARDEIPSWASPAVMTTARERLVVTNGARYIRGYAVESGAERWRLAHGSDIVVPTPVVSNDAGIAIVMSGYQPAKPIFAIRGTAEGDISLGGGEEASPHVAWSRARGGAYIPTPLIYRGRLYVLSSNGVLTCYEVASGRILYEERLAGRGAAYSASPVAADGRVYFASEDGDVHVVRAGDTYELLASNAVNEPLMATPALHGRMIIVRGLRHLYAFGWTADE